MSDESFIGEDATAFLDKYVSEDGYVEAKKDLNNLFKKEWLKAKSIYTGKDD